MDREVEDFVSGFEPAVLAMEVFVRSTAFALAAVTVFLLGIHATWADEPAYPYHMMWGGGWFMGPFMTLFFFAIVVVLVVLLVQRLWPANSSGNSDENMKSAVSILKERFARDEIDKEEFKEKKRLIGS